MLLPWPWIPCGRLVHTTPSGAWVSSVTFKYAQSSLPHTIRLPCSIATCTTSNSFSTSKFRLQSGQARDRQIKLKMIVPCPPRTVTNLAGMLLPAMGSTILSPITIQVHRLQIIPPPQRRNKRPPPHLPQTKVRKIPDATWPGASRRTTNRSEHRTRRPWRKRCVLVLGSL